MVSAAFSFLVREEKTEGGGLFEGDESTKEEAEEVNDEEVSASELPSGMLDDPRVTGLIQHSCTAT